MADNNEKHVKCGVVAGCVVRKSDTFLLVQEKQEKVYGLWCLPAGHVDVGETIEDAAKREVKEETGLEVVVGRKIGIYQDKASESVKHAYVAVVVGGTLSPQDEEILSAEWLTLDEIRKLNEDKKLRNQWVLDAIESSISL
jgi:8-oxo-dGTP diphosphatase